jgi:hypothetical protein
MRVILWIVAGVVLWNLYWDSREEKRDALVGTGRG